MSVSSKKCSEEFLKASGQFKLGALITEAAHPGTAGLSDVAKDDIPAALKLLFDVDEGVVTKFREFVQSGRATEMAAAVLAAVKNGLKPSGTPGLVWGIKFVADDLQPLSGDDRRKT